jgi:hypothetical protein
MGLFSALIKAASSFGEGLALQAEQFAKAQAAPVKVDDTEEPKALVWDPFAVIEQLGYRDKPSQITYGTLQAMVWRTPLIQNIILTRLNQISAFCQRQQDRFGTGFRVRPEDPTAKMSAADKKRAAAIESMFMTSGVVVNSVVERPGFERFMRSIGRDSMTYDQWCVELIRNRKGEPTRWYAVDASTIRLANMQSVRQEYDPKRPYVVQVYDNIVINQWTQEQFIFGIRNPHTHIQLAGYGVSELEMLLHAITAILWAWEYNQRFFSSGSVAKGILNIKGAMSQSQLRSFRRHWYEMISGIENAWRSPVLNTQDGVEWVSMHENNRDMEFSAWMDFLIKMIAACYQIDPMEVGFKYGDAGNSKSLFESGNKEKLTASRDKGLRPLLTHFSSEFTTNIVARIEPGFVFEWVGLERETKKELADINEVKLRTTHSLNELREEEGLPAIEGGDLPMNPTLIQHVQNQQQNSMQQAQFNAGGDQGEDGTQQGEAPNGFSLADFENVGSSEEPEQPMKKSRTTRVVVEV